MERLLAASQPFLPNHSETRGKDEMNHDEKLQSKEEATDQATTDQEMMTREGLDRRNVWEPSVYYALGKESFYFVGHEINIRECMDSYGALIWPGAIALSQFLENNQQQMNLMDKAVLELGAGTGLLSIVASLLDAALVCHGEETTLQRASYWSIYVPFGGDPGADPQPFEGITFPFWDGRMNCAWVTATDLPDILSNLSFNLRRNTKGHSRYIPQVAALSWGQGLEQDFPFPSYHYDYVLAADVVYHHDFLEELLNTMLHFCRPGSGTTLLWANKIRFQSDLRFTECFKSSFNTTLLTKVPKENVWIYKATAKE